MASLSQPIFPKDGGRCGEILRMIDWTSSSLGPPDTWPAPLKTAVNIVLTSRFPMMVHWGPDLITFYNDAYAPSLGKKHPGHLGRPAREWWSEMWDQLTPIFNKVLAGETVYHEDARYTPDREKGAQEAFFTHCHTPLWGEAGAIEGIFLTVVETTSRVLAERGRQIDEVRNRQIVDSATDFAIIATDLTGKVTRWNVGAERVLGWSEAEMCGNVVDRIFTPEDRAGGRPDFEMQSALEKGYGNDERWHLRKSGERFWAQGEMPPLKGTGGEVAGFVKVLRDRTHERLREQRLDLLSRASAGLLGAEDPGKVIHEVLSEGAGTLGFDQSYSYVLSEDEHHLHLTQSIGVSEELQQNLHSAPFDGPLCGVVAQCREPLIIDHLQATTEPRFEIGRQLGLRAFAGFPIIGRDTLFGVISFASTSSDVFNEEALGFFATIARFLSISQERVKTEVALRDLAMTLERRVDERTRELLTAEEALRQSQKMDAVGQLTGGVAHDFNNLLTVIRGSVDMLRRDNLAPERRTRYLDAIGTTAERATKLTGQLLAFARRQALRPEVFDVRDSLEGVADMLDSVTGARIQLNMQTAGIPCLVRADTSQFETALVNMAVNARDAMAGEGTLTIDLRCGLPLPPIRGHAGAKGPFVSIALADTGSGIPDDLLDRVFEPFFTTKEVGKGTGLGLSQVFGFAKQSGGDVDVASQPGLGTTFTLYLPEAEAGARVQDKAPEIDSTATRGDGLCVLVVEDNVEVGRFSTQTLEDFGYETKWVATAEEALEALGDDGEGFDAVFSDVVMPGMGGVELAKRLQLDLPEIPVLLASGYSHVLAEESRHGFELLHKPYSADQLSRVLQRVILARRQMDGPK
jgi:PAS domain S-box-containing protein